MFQFALNNLRSQKLRSLLCVVGIMIGVIGVICIFAFSQGIKSTVKSAIQEVEGLVVMEEGAVDPVLSSIPLRLKGNIQNVDGVQNVIPWIWTPATTINEVTLSERGFMQPEGIGGIDVEALSKTPKGHLYPRSLTRGRFLKPGDRNQTVISEMLADRYDKSIGDQILIRGTPFEIVGLYSVGNRLLDVAYIVPIEMARNMKSMSDQYVSSLHVVPEKGVSKEKLLKPVEEALMNVTVSLDAESQLISVEQKNSDDEAPLNKKDAETIQHSQDVKTAIPVLEASLTVKKTGEETSNPAENQKRTLYGINPENAASTGNVLFNRDGEGNVPISNSNEIMVSRRMAEELDVQPGDQLSAGSGNFQVGALFDGSRYRPAPHLITSLETARNLTDLPKNQIHKIIVVPENNADAEELANSVQDTLMRWDVRSKRDWQSDFSDIIRQIDVLLLLISSLAIVVGTVGIVNTMLMSVSERTTEFGILISSGWSSKDLLLLVMYESLLLGAAGGVAGVVLGWGCVQTVNLTFDLTIHATTPPLLLFLSFVLSVLVGIVGGLYPALRAARMDPIEAIRAVR